jgi:hypothetical protein
MIFQAIPPEGVIPSVRVVAVEQAATTPVYRSGAAAVGPAGTVIAQEQESDAAHVKTEVREVHEDFDWKSPKGSREFIRLEQKVLAGKAGADEQHRYQVMRRDRNSQVFSDRALHDYAEVQRLKKLSQKLAEVQQYLRPINI